jgi:hypothetical protein
VSKLHFNKGPLSASNALKKPKTVGALATCRFVPMTRVERYFSGLAFRRPSDVRYGSLADILISPRYVRFTPNNGRCAAHPSPHSAVGL